MLSPAQHSPYRCELLLGHNCLPEDIAGKLYGYLPDILGLASALFPYVLQILAPYQDEFEITDLLNAVTYDPAYPFSTLDEIEFEFLMLVERICEFRLVALHYIEAVFLRKTRDFSKYLAHVSDLTLI